ncbi:MAG: hypothetical protein K0A89_12575 [ANME-2 cluster archaeon]|nr:hypothetical protein [ANME-2 cluster archaeon]
MISPRSRMLQNCHGQMYTLEGAASAIMMIVLISFIVQASPLTPLTSSSSNQQVETQIEVRANDLITVLDYVPDGDTYSPLKQALLDWDGGEIFGQGGVYIPAVITLCDGLDDVILADGTAYNMQISYLDENNNWDTVRMIWNGLPSDNAIMVSKKVVIHDEDGINSESNIPDISSDTEFYNILDVRLTLWRM